MFKQKLRELLCWLKIHQYKVINVSFGFGASGAIETVECRFCGVQKTRKTRT